MDVYNRREIKENYLATCESQNGIFWFEITIIYDDIVISGRVYIAENNLNYMEAKHFSNEDKKFCVDAYLGVQK